MADFYGALESTSFRVRDRDTFLADPDVQTLSDYAKQDGFFDEVDGYFAFGWYGQYPSTVLLVGEEDEPELDVTAVISRHILPGDACQIAVSGNEKLRYIGGEINWITSNGVASFNGETDWTHRMSAADVKSTIVKLNESISRIL